MPLRREEEQYQGSAAYTHQSGRFAKGPRMKIYVKPNVLVLRCALASLPLFNTAQAPARPKMKMIRTLGRRGRRRIPPTQVR
jgi:hypothetical protein